MKKLIFCFFLISFCACAQDANKEKKTVLFVCEHGAARSLIATAYFNKLAAEKGLDYTAIFRGTSPDPELNAASVAGLKKDGFPIPSQKPMLVSKEDEQKATHLVTFDCTVPMETNKPKDNWANISSINQNYDKARDEILKHVNELILELQKKEKR